MLFDRLRKVALGALRTRITLCALVANTDDIGGVTQDFTPIANLWCNIEPFSGDDRFSFGKIEETVSHRILIRWRNDVSAPKRFYLGPRSFLIRGVADPDGRRRRLSVLVEEIKP